MNIVNLLFFLTALIFSISYGFWCKEIWFPDDDSLSISRYIYEIWFNFIGSFVGWMSLYVLYRSFLNSTWIELATTISWTHLFLLIIGLLGITGLLPYTLWSISRAPGGVMDKIK